MASKRKIRRDKCERKIRYPDQAAAVRACISYRQAHGGNVRTYKCNICHGWHFGHYGDIEFGRRP